MASQHVTVYEIKSGKAVLCYPCSVQEFMNTGLYTTEKPAGAKRPEAAVKAQKPTAGREADRLPLTAIQVEKDAAPVAKPAEDVKVEVKEEKEEAPKPARKAPRRRADA